MKKKNWLFGYLFKKAKIEKLNNEFKKSFNLSLPFEPHQSLAELKTSLIYFLSQMN